MTSETWQKIKDALAAMEDAAGEERAAVLDRVCGGDDAVRREVESLLAQEDKLHLFDRTGRGRSMDAAPRQIGAYRIERVLGSGGMGTVYLASRADDQYKKQVAIKVIQAAGGGHLVRRFRTERQILARLEHPHIARLLDGGALDDGRPYLVMEYVEGERIDRYVDGRKLAVPEKLRLFLKICSAVQYAHENLVVHRDIKPGNILVNAAGEPRLLDFGIAKALAEEAEGAMESTQPFERLLTPSAASPEQVAGAPATTSSDVYSLGVLLYRLLTGVSPYAGSPDFSTQPAAVIARYEPPPASAAAADKREAKALRGDLDNILAKSLEKEPARRYRTVDEFAADLERYLDGRPVKARPASFAYRASKFVLRNRFAVAAAILLCIAIAAGTAGTLAYARRARAEQAVADRRFDALRKLSESLVFELHDSIQNLPGATAARALVVRRALEYLDQLAADSDNNRAVLRDLGSAYQRIATLEGSERGPHLGGPGASNDAAVTFEKALAIRRKLAAAAPNDAAAQKDLLDSIWELAAETATRGDLAGSEQLHLERLRIIEAALAKHDTTDMRYSQAVSLTALGDVHRTTGDYDRSLQEHRQALAIREKLVASDPNNVRFQRARAMSHEFIGYTLAARGSYGEAAAEHRIALAVYDRLTRQTPDNVDYQRLQLISRMNLCEDLTRTGELAGAEAYCRDTVTEAEAMNRADPQNLQTGEDLAAAEATMAFALEGRKQLRDALAWERRAIDRYRTVTQREPDSTYASGFYAEALLELGKIERKVGDAHTCADIAEATRLLESEAAASPLDRSTRKDLDEARKARSGCEVGGTR